MDIHREQCLQAYMKSMTFYDIAAFYKTSCFLSHISRIYNLSSVVDLLKSTPTAAFLCIQKLSRMVKFLQFHSIHCIQMPCFCFQVQGVFATKTSCT